MWSSSLKLSDMHTQAGVQQPPEHTVTPPGLEPISFWANTSAPPGLAVSYGCSVAQLGVLTARR